VAILDFNSHKQNTFFLYKTILERFQKCFLPNSSVVSEDFQNTFTIGNEKIIIFTL
jgi:hypothetical protein